MTQTLPPQNYDISGNYINMDACQISWDTGAGDSITNASTRPYILAGTGAPTVTAPIGSLYTRLDGSSSSTRLYVSEGSGTWTNVTTAA
jgi:hypothetical protein